MFLRKSHIPLLILLLPLSAWSQLRPSMADAKMGGFILRTNGLGVQYVQKQEINEQKNLILGLEALNHRHPSEMRIMSSDNFDPGTYVYGKLHHVGLLRSFVGLSWNLNGGEKSGKNGIYLQCQTGPQLVFLKPVYLRVLNYTQQDEGFVKMERFNAEQPQNKELILGEAPFSYGLNESSLKGGFFFKPSLALEWVNQSGGSRQFELGWCLDYMPLDAQIMARQQAQRLYSSFFIALLIGKTVPPEEARPVF